MASFVEELLRVREGEAAAIERLFARWRPLLRVEAHGMLGGGFAARTDSSDVVQDTLAQAFRDVAQFRGQTEGEWVSWLRSILSYQASKLRRRHLAEMRSVDREAPLAAEPLQDRSDPLEKVTARDRLARLAEAIEALPAGMREVVVRRVFRQQSFDQIADELRCSSGAARVSWTRAVRRLRDWMRRDDSSLPPHGAVALNKSTLNKSTLNKSTLNKPTLNKPSGSEPTVETP